jgi:sugar phosphate isomerase/epimerase
MTILPALCSVTFRRLTPAEVIALAAANGIAAIEWGGDIHLPPGDPAAATALGARTRDAGIVPISYGTYIYAGDSASRDVAPAIETAAALGAQHLRVWAGPRKVASRDCTPAQWDDSVAALQHIARTAAAHGLAVSLEFHDNSLTDDIDSACRLLAAVDRPNLWSLWQPRGGMPRAEALAQIERLRGDLSHLHVFCWSPSKERHPLETCADFWRVVLGSVPPGRWPGPRYAFLEFVAGDDPAQLARDAATLHRILAEIEDEEGTVA